MTELLDVLTGSEKRKQIILLLQISDQTPEAIRMTLGYTATAFLPQIRILESHGLIRQVDHTFMLTPFGRICADLLSPLVRMTDFLGSHEEYWRTHLISAVPADLLSRIHELGTISILTARADDLFIAKDEFRREVTKTTRFQGMSAMVHPHHLELFHEIAVQGADIIHILSPEAAGTLIRIYPEKTRKLLSMKEDCFFVSSEEFPWECVITDRAVFFSLFTNDGMADPHHDLYAPEPRARRWASELFARYLASSRRLELDILRVRRS